jgi:hypothetical protein
MATIVRILKEEAERRLSDVPEEHAFRCHDGSTLRSMRELGAAFNSMTDENYAYHSNAERQDFSSWVNDIIGDDKLARDLAKSPDRIKAAKKVAERLSFLSAKLA